MPTPCFLFKQKEYQAVKFYHQIKIKKQKNKKNDLEKLLLTPFQEQLFAVTFQRPKEVLDVIGLFVCFHLFPPLLKALFLFVSREMIINFFLINPKRTL